MPREPVPELDPAAEPGKGLAPTFARHLGSGAQPKRAAVPQLEAFPIIEYRAMLTAGFAIVTTHAMEIMMGNKDLEKLELPGKDFLETDDVVSLALKDPLE
jgi:hypothetical protein